MWHFDWKDKGRPPAGGRLWSGYDAVSCVSMEGILGRNKSRGRKYRCVVLFAGMLMLNEVCTGR